MRKANVYKGNTLAGVITEGDNGYSFTYDLNWLNSKDAEPISLTMPLTKESYESMVLFPFFDGLIPEGWLLDIAQRSWKIDRRDRFSLLLACCKDCIGDISVVPIKNVDYE